MNDSTWTVVFKDNRSGREGSLNFDNERDFQTRIESIKSDHWLMLVKGTAPDGTEVTG